MEVLINERIVVLIIAILMFSILAHAEEGDRYEAERLLFICATMLVIM